MDSAKIIKEKKEQMIEWAKTRDNIIRYERVVDILCDKDDSVTEETIKHVIEDLTEHILLSLEIPMKGMIMEMLI